MKHARSVLSLGLKLVSVWLILCAVIGVVAEKWSLHPGSRALRPADEARARVMAVRDHAELADGAVTAEDGVTLRAWSLRPANGNGDAVILLHGVADNRMGMLGYADLLLRHGFAVLLPDARAHGQSGGDVVTYGAKEAGDVRRWFDWVEQADGPRCVDGLGNSMGAAVLLESLRTTPGFCAVVAESPFANFREASFDRMGQWTGTAPWFGRTMLRPAVETGILYSRLRYGVDLGRDSPEDAVAASKVPVLLIHGKRDDNLPAYNSEMILARSRSRGNAVALWEPAEAGHTGAARAEPEEYERRVVGWFEGHTTPGGDDAAIWARHLHW
ncbi:MAG: alpha/beta fold hydrolase [Terracidiphilus sp.]|jgi:dipeptidyl aminopeptidase/acylaminoacyl peptidase